LSDIELPEGIVPVGNLYDAIVCLDIPSCGKAMLWEHDGMRYIRPSEGCTLDKRQMHHDAYKRKVERLARKYGVAVEPQQLGVTIDRLKQKHDVRLPEQHSCQDGVLWLGPSQPRRTKDAADDRPPWIIQAEKRLTKYPYSLLFSFLHLVKEPKAGDTLDDCVPSDEVLKWFSMYGLTDTEEWHTDERHGCLQLDRFQRETVILYLLFHLWKARIKWQLFEKESAPSDPEEGDRHREAIYHYACLLLMLRKARGSFLSAEVNLEGSINREQWLKQQLDRGIFVYLDLRTKQTFDLKKEYVSTKTAVNGLAKAFINEVIRQRMRLTVYPSFVASKIIVQAQSVFDVCYSQLGQVTTMSPDESRRYLRLCEVPSCGRLFWAPHGHHKRCEEHPRRAVWAWKARQSQGRKRKTANLTRLPNGSLPGR
jgi:hypothetical protein